MGVPVPPKPGRLQGPGASAGPSERAAQYPEFGLPDSRDSRAHDPVLGATWAYRTFSAVLDPRLANSQRVLGRDGGHDFLAKVG